MEGSRQTAAPLSGQKTPVVVYVVFSWFEGASHGLAYWGATEEIARMYGGPVIRVELPADADSTEGGAP